MPQKHDELICELHGIPLEPDMVPVFYESEVSWIYLDFIDDYGDEFPNARTRVTLPDTKGNPTARAPVRFCPECREWEEYCFMEAFE